MQNNLTSGKDIRISVDLRGFMSDLEGDIDNILSQVGVDDSQKPTTAPSATPSVTTSTTTGAKTSPTTNTNSVAKELSPNKPITLNSSADDASNTEKKSQSTNLRTGTGTRSGSLSVGKGDKYKVTIFGGKSPPGTTENPEPAENQNPTASLPTTGSSPEYVTLLKFILSASFAPLLLLFLLFLPILNYSISLASFFSLTRQLLFSFTSTLPYHSPYSSPAPSHFL